MINLLPPDLKEQIRYAKLNRMALGYARVLVMVVVVLAVVFGGGLYLIEQQKVAVAADVAEKQKTISDYKSTFLPKAKDASERLNAIKFVQGTQTRFSVLIADIAKVIPQGVSIDTLTLTGDETKPVKINASSTTYDQALALRDALVKSPRIAAADIETINQGATAGSPYKFKVTMVIGFKPGQAR